MAKPATDPPSLPNLEKLEIKGIPTVREKTLNEAFSTNAERRKKLLGIMQSSMLNWPK